MSAKMPRGPKGTACKKNRCPLWPAVMGGQRPSAISAKSSSRRARAMA